MASARVGAGVSCFLRFDGQGAGLGKRVGGDSNSPFDYTLVCQCGLDLGPLGRFIPSEEGVRSANCMICDQVIMVHGTQIVRVVPGVFVRATLDAMRRKKKEDEQGENSSFPFPSNNLSKQV